MQWDSMGHDLIVYFPRVEYTGHDLIVYFPRVEYTDPDDDGIEPDEEDR
jgi:hypothetical protein